MTYRELSDYMDVLSNRFALEKNTSVVPFDEYEKSVFLTKAANEIIKEMLPFYDRNEKIKQQLLPLTRVLNVSTLTSSGTISLPMRYNASTLVYEIPSDIMYIVSEALKSSAGAILKRIRPLKDDEAYFTLENPFRVTSRSYAFRTGLSTDTNGVLKEYSEIITNVPASPVPTYHVKYLANVSPFIVTEDLEDATISGLGSLPVGITLDDEAPLPMLHEKILDRAILIGYLAKSDDVNAKSASINLSTNS